MASQNCEEDLCFCHEKALQIKSMVQAYSEHPGVKNRSQARGSHKSSNRKSNNLKSNCFSCIGENPNQVSLP